MSDKLYHYDGSRIWLMCSWEYGPVCFGMALDIIGGLFFIATLISIIGVSFFGWFDIKPKMIRRKLHD